MNKISLKPLQVSDWPEELRSSMKAMISPSGNTIDLFKVLAHNPAVLGGIGSGSRELSIIDRETVVVRTLLKCHNHYEKFYHKKMFLRCGGDPAVLAGLLDPWLGGLSGKPRALALAVDETINDRRISPETLEKLQEWFDGARVLEILQIISSYAFLTSVINTSGITLEDEADRISDDLMAQVPEAN